MELESFHLTHRKKLIFTAVFLGTIFLFALNQITEADTGFLIKTGEFIAEHGTIPRTDVFSYAAEGAPWIAHYWMPSLFFYFINEWFGLWGLIVSVTLIATVTFFILLHTTRQKNFLFSFIIFPFFFWLTFGSWSARPQIFSYLFVAILLWLLWRYRETRRSAYLYGLPFLILMWANSHASVLLGLLIISLFCGTILLESRFRITKENIKITAIAIISWFVSLINPYGIKTVFYNFIVHPVLKELVVSEWRPLWSVLYKWQAKTFLGIMLIVLFMLARVWWKKYKETKTFDLFHAGLVLAAFTLPFFAVRHVMLFSLLTFPVFIDATREYANRFRISRITLGVVLFLIFIAGVARADYIFSKGLVNKNFLPVGAVDFIEEQNIRGPMFNVEYGSYILWRLYPKERVFLDGRSDVYAGKPAEEFLAIALQKEDPPTLPTGQAGGKQGWKELVNEKYKINYFIFPYHPPIDVVTQNLTVRLMRELGFRLVYWDDISLILVRDVPENKEVIEKFAYRLINPFRDPNVIPLERIKEAVQEVQRALALTPDSIEIAAYARSLLVRVAQEEKNKIK